MLLYKRTCSLLSEHQEALPVASRLALASELLAAALLLAAGLLEALLELPLSVFAEEALLPEVPLLTASSSLRDALELSAVEELLPVPVLLSGLLEDAAPLEEAVLPTVLSLLPDDTLPVSDDASVLLDAVLPAPEVLSLLLEDAALLEDEDVVPEDALEGALPEDTAVLLEAALELPEDAAADELSALSSELLEELLTEVTPPTVTSSWLLVSVVPLYVTVA